VFSTSFEKSVLAAGTATFGAFPLELRDELLETIASLALKHCLPSEDELTQIVETARGWPHVITQLQNIAESAPSIENTQPRKSLRKRIKQLVANLLTSK
jgi:hypothetical protein